MVGVFLKIHPTRSPTVNVPAVVPKEIDAILIVPRIFPKSAVRLIKINSGYILLSIFCSLGIDLKLSVCFFANICVNNTVSITPNKYEHPYPIIAFSLPNSTSSQTLDNPGVLLNAPHRIPRSEE